MGSRLWSDYCDTEGRLISLQKDRKDDLQILHHCGSVPLHLSSEDVALLMMGKFSLVGSEYAAPDDVWNAKPDVHVIGLLQVIVKELRALHQQPNRVSASMFAHRKYLNSGGIDRKSLENAEDAELARIMTFVGSDGVRLIQEKTKYDSRRDQVNFWDDIESHYQYQLRLITDTRDVLVKLRQINSIDDLILLKGVGNKTLAKLKASIEDGE